MTVYARVSTDDQNVKQQAKYVVGYFEARGWKIKKVVMDTESGRKPLLERKKFIKLLDEVVVGTAGQAIGIFKLDRLTRNWHDESPIEKVFSDNWSKCKLLSAGESIELSDATGRLNFRLMMVISCFMPEDMLEKQKVGIARAQKEGK